MSTQHPHEPTDPHQDPASSEEMDLEELEEHIAAAESLHRELSDRLEATGRD